MIGGGFVCDLNCIYFVGSLVVKEVVVVGCDWRGCR